MEVAKTGVEVVLKPKDYEIKRMRLNRYIVFEDKRPIKQFKTKRQAKAWIKRKRVS